jgi:hypothetical protein
MGGDGLFFFFFFCAKMDVSLFSRFCLLWPRVFKKKMKKKKESKRGRFEEHKNSTVFFSLHF